MSEYNFPVMSTLRYRCYACGHRLALASDSCPQCDIAFDSRTPPKRYPETCQCQRCEEERKGSIDKRRTGEGAKKAWHTRRARRVYEERVIRDCLRSLVTGGHAPERLKEEARALLEEWTERERATR